MKQPGKSRQARWQDARRVKGLCIACGIEPLRTKNHCERCATRAREAARKWNHALVRYKNALSYQKLDPQAKNL